MTNIDDTFEDFIKLLNDDIQDETSYSKYFTNHGGIPSNHIIYGLRTGKYSKFDLNFDWSEIEIS